MTSPSDGAGHSCERELAPRLFNRTWELLDLEVRTSDDEEEMLAATLAQRHLWYQVGTVQNRAVADWQVSRVAAVLGLADLADRFGRLSLTLCEEHELGAFYRAYAHEAIARAADIVGDGPTRDRHVLAAREHARRVADEDERAMLLADVDLVSGE